MVRDIRTLSDHGHTEGALYVDVSKYCMHAVICIRNQDTVIQEGFSSKACSKRILRSRLTSLDEN